jgi:heme oxygenase (biliverdin-IX-beta and delta-forming)
MLVARLREGTAKQHKSVEDRLDLLSPELTPARYARILQVFQAFVEPWEKELDTHCPDRYRDLWRGRQKAFKLDADLLALGSERDLNLTGAPEIPRLSEEGLWLGSLYVMEGSMLGGRIISRRLEERFGWSGDHGCSYFAGYKEQTSARWQEVCVALTESTVSGNQVVEGAHLTFDSLERWLAVCL